MKLLYSSLAFFALTAVLNAADLPTSLGKKYVINSSGTYNLKANSTGNLFITADNVIIDGQGFTLTGVIDSARLDDAIINSTGNNTTVKNVKVVIGDGGLFGIWLKGDNSNINGTTVTSPDTVGTTRGRGGLETGKGGRISNCTITPGDDAIRLTADDTVADNCTVNMQGNGSAIQYGYGKKYRGTQQHKASRITVNGQTRKNGNFTKDEIDPNRCVVGGWWGTVDGYTTNVGNAQAISIDVRMNNADALCRFYAENKTMDGVTFSGSINKNTMTLGCSAATNPIPIMTARAASGGTLKNVSITIGDAWLKANYKHGDLEKEYVYSNGSASGTVNGWTLTNTNNTIKLPNPRL